MKRLLVLLVLLHGAASALAVQPDEMLNDPALEARARVISAGLRCLVCQNQSIDDSDAGVARDLRLLIREQLQEGKSDAEVVDFVVARFGDFVLLKPRFSPATWALWLAPFLILAAGLAVAWPRRRASQVKPLNEKEKAEIEAIVGQSGDPSTRLPQD